MGLFDDLIPNQKPSGTPSGLGPSAGANAATDLTAPQAPPASQPTDFRAQLDQSIGPVEKARINLGRGVMDMFEGGQQLALQAGEKLGLVDQSSVEAFNKEAQQERDLFERGSVDEGALAKSARFAGQVAPFLGVPAASAARLGTGTATAVNAAAGAGFGATEFVEDDDSRLGNTVTGAVGGAVAPLIGEKLARGAIRAVDAVRKAKTPLEKNAAKVVALVGDDAPETTKRRAMELVSEGLDPEQAARAANLEELGIQPTRAQITKDLSDVQFERRALFNADEAAAPVRERAADNNRALLDTLDDRVTQQGGQVDDAFDVGSSVQEGVQAGKAARHADTDRAFTELRENLPTDLSVRVDNFKTELDEALDFVVETPAIDGIARRLRRFGVLDGEDNVVGDLTLERAETIRRVINDRIDGASRQSQRALVGLRNALTKDVENSVGEDVFRPARDVAKREFGFFDNRKIVKDILDEKIAPDDVVRRMASQTVKTKDVQELVDTLANNPQSQQALNDLRAGVATHLKDKALLGRQLNMAEDPIVAGANFAKAVRNLGRAKLSALFGDEGAQDFMRLANLMQRATSEPRNVGSSSGTAEVLNSIANQARSIASGIPAVQTILTIIEPWRKAMRNRAFSRGVKEAVDQPVKSIAARNRGESAATKLKGTIPVGEEAAQEVKENFRAESAAALRGVEPGIAAAIDVGRNVGATRASR